MSALSTTTKSGTPYAKALVTYRRRAGKRLTQERKLAGLTLRALAGRLGLGAWSHIAAVEAGRVAVTPELAKRIATALRAPTLEAELLRARDPIPEAVLVLLLKSPKLLARLETRATKQ